LRLWIKLQLQKGTLLPKGITSVLLTPVRGFPVTSIQPEKASHWFPAKLSRYLAALGLAQEAQDQLLSSFTAALRETDLLRHESGSCSMKAPWSCSLTDRLEDWQSCLRCRRLHREGPGRQMPRLCGQLAQVQANDEALDGTPSFLFGSASEGQVVLEPRPVSPLCSRA